MKITGFDYKRYRLRFKKKFSNSKGIITERNGFLVNLKSNELSAYGDIAPFPELGSESFATAENILKELKTSFLYLPVNYNSIDEINKVLEEIDSFPTIRHGLEQAILSLAAKEKKLTFESLLNVSSRNRVILNALIGLIKPKEIEQEVKRYINSGYSAIKLKAGRENFSEDLEAIRIARNIAGGDISLRIDVNGKWEFDDAVDNLKHLQEFNIEYVEQPVRTKEDLAELSKLSKVPLAADESIGSVADAMNFIEKRYCDALVIKPMMLGGIINTLKILREAEKSKIKVVISSSFESFVGKKAALFLASTIKDDHAHGLGTDEFFQEQERLKIIDGSAVIDNPEDFLT